MMAVMDARRADLVLEGGGVKGIGLAGAAAAITDAGYTPNRVSGTSAGALVGAVVAAGARGDALRGIARSLDFRAVADAEGVARLPLVGPALALLTGQGVYQGDYLLGWIRDRLAELGVHTFADLRCDDPHLPPDHRYRLVVTCSDLTLGQLVRLPWDYRTVYDLDPDEQPVAEAVRASMSIPFLFRPTTLCHADGAVSTLVDGGLLSNFPIDSLDRVDGLPPEWPTFGVTITTRPRPGVGERVALFRPGAFDWPQPAVLRLLEQLITTVVLGRDQGYLNRPWVAARTIHVDASQVGLLDLSVTRERSDALYETGYEAARGFLEAFDWDAYRERFRHVPQVRA